MKPYNIDITSLKVVPKGGNSNEKSSVVQASLVGRGHKDVRLVKKVPKEWNKNHKNLTCFKCCRKVTLYQHVTKKGVVFQTMQKKRNLFTLNYFVTLSLILDKSCSNNFVLKVKR